MPTIVSPSMTRSAPMFFSAISLSASNIDAVGPTVWTVGSDFDRRICATLFIGASRDKRTLCILASEPLCHVATSAMCFTHRLYCEFYSAEHVLLAATHTLGFRYCQPKG